MSAPASRPSEPQDSRLYLLHHSDLPAQRLIRQPLPVRRLAMAIAIGLPLLALLLLLLPWQQSAAGQGRVIAWAPENRQQTIDATIDGRLVKWFVQEGQFVAAGDPLAELADNDPRWLERLQGQREAAEQSMDASSGQVQSYEAKLLAAEASRDLSLAEYDAKIASLRRKRVGEQAELDTNILNLDRVEVLTGEGIRSTRDGELARLYRDKARAAVEARDQEIAATRQARNKAAADADAKIASARAQLGSARSKLAESRQKLLDVEGKLARQETQRLTAPRDGIILAVHGGPGGAQVKKGDRLITLVPQAQDRAVELWIDGNDMPLVQQGEYVRVLFEGWPALQFVGLPGGGTGMFDGTVSWVDPADDGKGKFRVVVVPEEGAEWPSTDRLRQGVRAKGFVLLNRVSLGYEIWRQINGFPALPVVEKGEKTSLPSSKKPKAPTELK